MLRRWLAQQEERPVEVEPSETRPVAARSNWQTEGIGAVVPT